MRNVPLLQRHYELNDSRTDAYGNGFAGFSLIHESDRKEGNKYFGERNGVEYEIKDDSAEYFYTAWRIMHLQTVLNEVLQK